jgi:hypothetical protein
VITRFLGIGGLILGVVLAALPVRAEVSALIVPGQSLGPVSLGMTEAEAAAALGRSVSGPGGALTFPAWKITVIFDGGAAVRISTADPQFRTRRGAGVGTGPDVATQLIGDFNELYTGDGDDLTIVYPFQGIGFNFHSGRAVEVYVIQPIRLGPPPAPEAPPNQAPPDETAPGATQPQQVPLPGTLQLQGLGEVVDVVVGRLVVSGRMVNTGAQPIGPVTVAARFVTSDKQETRAQTVLQQPLVAGTDVPFTLETSLAQSVVVRYTVEVTANSAGGSPLVQEQRIVPAVAYTDLARQRIVVSVQLGAPSNTAPMVQVLVSISGTTPIPPEWIREVQVDVPYTGGVRSVTLAPGQTQTILIPSVAQVIPPRVQGVILSAP